MSIKLVVIGLTFFEERSQVIGKGFGFGAIGLKAGGFMDVVIPVFCPYSVFGARLGFPREHCGVKGYVQGVAEFSEDMPWIFEEFSRIEHGEFLTYGVKIVQELGLHFVACVAQGGDFELVDERGQHVNGVAREQDIVSVCKKVTADFDEVVSHLFHKEYRAITCTENDVANDGFAIAFHSGYDFTCAGMCGRRYAQIMAVEGLVDYAGV